MSTPHGMDHGAHSDGHAGHHPRESSPSSENHHGGHESDSVGHGTHRGHGLMMIICCIPMLVIAGLLFLTGIAGTNIIVVALLCTAMMAAMMFVMPGGHDDK